MLRAMQLPSWAVIRELFRDSGGLYENSCSPSSFYMDERVQNIIDNNAFSTMLDLGAGAGRFSLYAASKGIGVTAVEKQEN